MGRKKKEDLIIKAVADDETSAIMNSTTEELAGSGMEDHVAVFTPTPDIPTVSEVDQPKSPQETTLTPLNKYDVLIEHYGAYKEIKISGPEDKVGFKKADEARKELKKVRVEATKTGEAILEPFKNVIKIINTRKTYIEKEFEKIEDHLEEEIRIYKEQVAEAERKKQEEEAAKVSRRIDQITTLGAKHNGFGSYIRGEFSINAVEIRSMSDEEFINITSAMEEENERVRAAELALAEAEKAEKERLKKEAEERKAEADRLQKANDELLAELKQMKADKAAADAKAEADRLAKEKEETDKAAKEKAEKDAADALAASKLAEVREAQLTAADVYIEMEYLLYKGRPVGDIEELHLDEDSWNNVIGSLPSLKAQIDQAIEEEVKEVFANAKAEEERLESMKSDKEKIVKFLGKIASAVVLPKLKSDEIKAEVELFEIDIHSLINEFQEKINSL